MKMGWFLQFMFRIKKIEDLVDFLLLIDDGTSRYVYIKDFNRFMFHKTKVKTKNGFVEVVYSVLVVKMY